MSVVTGTDAGERLPGTGGHDTISGGGGNDTLTGEIGDDRLWGGAADDHFGLGTGDDLLDGGPGNDVINGGDGDDTLRGRDDRDYIYGGRGADSLSGDAGNDDLSADLGDLQVEGGDGDDRISISAAPSGETQRLGHVAGGGGNDTFSLFATPTARLVVDGGAGNNVLNVQGSALDTIEIHLDQPHDGHAVVALGVRTVSIGDSSGFASISAHVFGSDGADTITTRGVNDRIHGGGGNDVLTDNIGRYGPTAPQESIFGGEGDDQIIASGENNFLRGDEGADSIRGGSGFDDIHGNVGADTLSGRFGDDWVVGGKDNDRLDGDEGGDIVYGNLGNDTCDGGYHNDIVRGGQGDDIVRGGDGDDFVSGDRGDDTVTGGAGADTFHAFQDSGIDRVRDFSQVQGDRVILSPGTTYSVSQVGIDTVVDFGGGHRMILEGVALATLRDGWISGGATPAPSNSVGPPTALAGFSPPNFVAWAYDATRGLIYTASTDGVVRSWNFLTNTGQTVANVGGNPSSLAVTPDGLFLLVGDSQATPVSGTGFFDPYTATITRIDLQTQARDQIQYTVANGQRGVGDLAVAADGTAYATQSFSGSGSVTFWGFDPAVATPNVTNALSPYSVGQRSPIVVSDNGRYLMIIDTSSSPGGFTVFDSVTDRPIFPSGSSPVRNFNIGSGDISEAAGQLVHVQATGLYVWNLGSTITFAQDLSSFTQSADPSASSGRVIGAHFSANGQFLYLWDAHQDSILAVDRGTWTVVGAVQVRADVRYDYFSTHQGEMDLTADGRHLILDTGTGLEVIDLAVQLSVRQSGTDASERFHGDVGRDTLDGGGGADTLIGYGGDDVLLGGRGADVFIAVPGGGVDRIVDFSAAEGDRLQVLGGQSYSVAQAGADAVVTLTDGGQVVLAGVQTSTLGSGWIFGG